MIKMSGIMLTYLCIFLAIVNSLTIQMTQKRPHEASGSIPGQLLTFSQAEADSTSSGAFMASPPSLTLSASVLLSAQPDRLASQCPAPLSLSLKQPYSNRTEAIPNIPPPPPGATISLDRSMYMIQGNLRTIYYDKSYPGFLGLPVVYERVIVAERINKSIPEPNELAASESKAKPFYGYIDDPSTFTNWQGLSAAIFEELNLARTQPAKYAEFVKEQLDTFQDDDATFKQGTHDTMSTEGSRAWVEAIDYLKNQRPVGALRRIKCLDCTASFMAADSSRNAIIAHIDSMSRTSADRTEMACLTRTGGENIAYGMLSARSAVVQLIVDDGVPDRGHRTNIFQNFTQVGIASGPYELQYQTITVHDFLY